MLVLQRMMHVAAKHKSMAQSEEVLRVTGVTPRILRGNQKGRTMASYFVRTR
jgi:hypothetical protein